jgi:hypothetical protein
LDFGATANEIDRVCGALVLIGLVVAFSLLRSEHRKENDAMNSLMVIVPYKYEGLFGFR